MVVFSLVADNLRRFREEIGLTQEEVAEALDLHPMTVSSHERGVRNPDEGSLDKYAVLYNTTRAILRYGREGRDVSDGGVIESDRNPQPVPQLPPSVRVWLKGFEFELAKAGASDDQIEEARTLLLNPAVFTYFVGGQPQPFTEAQALEGMQAIAAAIRKRLAWMGLKFND